jgi:hypothetical protein
LVQSLYGTYRIFNRSRTSGKVGSGSGQKLSGSTILVPRSGFHYGVNFKNLSNRCCTLCTLLVQFLHDFDSVSLAGKSVVDARKTSYFSLQIIFFIPSLFSEEKTNYCVVCRTGGRIDRRMRGRITHSLPGSRAGLWIRGQKRWVSMRYRILHFSFY